MSSSLLEVAFAHHVWATLRLIDACLDLSVEELETSVPGTRGPVVETLRHVVLSDAFDLFTLNGDRAFDIDEEHVSLAEARLIMERNGSGWAAYISRSPDPDETSVIVEADVSSERWGDSICSLPKKAVPRSKLTSFLRCLNSAARTARAISVLLKSRMAVFAPPSTTSVRWLAAAT